MDGVGTSTGVTPPSPARALVAVVGSVAGFACLVEPAGLLIATATTVLVATSGAGRLTLRAALVYAVVLACLAALLFVVALGQPIRLLPRV